MAEVLYHCVSMYHTIEAMAHRKLYHSEDYAVLAMPEFSKKKFSDCGALSDFFDEVVWIPEYMVEYTPHAVLQCASDIYDPLFEQHDFEKIYVAAAHYCISLYLMETGRKFVFMEDGCGILCRPEVSYSIVKNYNSVQAEIAATYGLFDGKNPMVEEIICDEGAQTRPLECTVSNFNVTSALRQCGSEYIEKILGFFGIKKKFDICGSTVLLTQQLANLGITDFEGQRELYCTMVDFFVPDDSITIKPHPDDVMYYGKFMPQAKIINDTFPSELLPFIAVNAGKGITAFSSSAFSFGRDDLIFCGYDFGSTYKKTEAYYSVLKMLEKFKGYSLAVYGADADLIDNILNNTDIRLEFSEVKNLYELTVAPSGTITLIDDRTYLCDRLKKTTFEFEKIELPFSDERVNEETELLHKEHENRFISADTEKIVQLLKNAKGPVIFVNTERDYCFYSYDNRDLFREMLPVHIKGTRSFTAYIYAADPEERNRIMKNKIKKELKTSECTLEAYIPEDPSERRIMILEGMLEATEKKLLWYIQKEKEEQAASDKE